MKELEEGYLAHYGMPRRSGRYPYGSGEDPYQHEPDFAGRVQKLRSEGMKDTDIVKELGLKSTTELRTQYSKSLNDRRRDLQGRANSLLADGYSKSEVARMMGMNESSLRSLLNQQSTERMNAAEQTAQFLKEQIDEKGMIDVGVGVERELGISKEKLTTALDILEEQGYPTYGARVPQATNPGKMTTIRVACPPDAEHKDIYDYDKINSVTDYRLREDPDGSEHYDKAFEYPKAMDAKRLDIRYRDDVAPDGHTGVEKDGTIELRRGVADLDLGESNYAQVRILVDMDPGNPNSEKRYLKGMAFYSDDLPAGKDVVFNTNKTRDIPPDEVMKKIHTEDPMNPFGSAIKENGGQYHYTDENGERQLGLINKRAAEGDWNDWADTVPSQFLAKQSQKLINQQLHESIADKQAEFDDICRIDNPTVKKQLLESFASDCDSSAVHLKAAALPRQKYQVILPISTMKDNEIYAPNFIDGETVALIRYPHGGTFEIPVLKVNNKQADGKKILGNTPLDAVGINSKVAERLSGADFDGDTVMVIPCNSQYSNVKITSKPPLKGLEGFDPKLEYPERKGMKYMTKANTQMEMGKISNLIMDMTLQDATEAELARAVRHSMVVIDANKHKLDYKRSEEENGIAALKKKYQYRVDPDGTEHNGAATLITRAKSPVQVTKRRGQPKIDPNTGELIYQEVHETYVDKKTGKTKTRMQDAYLMETIKDARVLSSGTPQEEAYAAYANKMKAMANEARKEMVHTGKIPYSKEAKTKYSKEVGELKNELDISLRNAPRERKAQLSAAAEYNRVRDNNPDMSKADLKKTAQRSLAANRAKYGATRHVINITPKQWEAIQAGAVSENTLSQILRFADSTQVRQYATPRENGKAISSAKQARIKSMKASGYTTRQIADALGVSPSTVQDYISGKE